ncbi:MAG: ASCH domain-containing protein [Chloroflexota bacterium]|nr:ASCH domain-containing protein [Dehalococcoidia bacterium]MDW8253677.1 ASCH domain-containing protein [Chloroflexota bacterium]
MRHHLAVFAPQPLADILAGRKTIESRFARDRRPPYGRVAPGDLLWLKQSGGPLVGVATAAWVEEVANLTPDRVTELFERYPGILADPPYRAAKRSARFATIIGLTAVRPLDACVIAGRGRSGWRLLAGPPVDCSVFPSPRLPRR